MKEPKLYPRTYTIHTEPDPQGGLLVTIPEIDARLHIESTQMQDALDAAHSAIEEQLKAEYEAALAAKAS